MKRISDKLHQMINTQIKREMDSSHLYLAIAQWFDFKGWFGGAELYKKYAKEELEHAYKLADYLQDRDAMPDTPMVDKQPTTFDGIESIIQTTYDHEVQVSKWLNDIAMEALTSRDLTTYQFLQWFINEQIEEEKKALDLMDRLAIIKNTNTPLYFFDEEMKKRV